LTRPPPRGVPGRTNAMQGPASEISNEKKETVGAYITNVLLSMLFPFMALWYGPKYLLKGELIKGIVIILIVAAELTVVYSMYR
jgi:hypothetical protein